MTGIYKIENLVNGKIYIGQSVNLDNRFYGHKHTLQNNTHKNRYLQRAYNKYGEENFKFEIIEECEEDKLTEREQYWIDYYGGLNSSNNYNFRNAGNCGSLSDISKQKLREANLGKHHSEETKQKMSRTRMGRKYTPEHCANISKAQKGNIKMKRVGQNNGMYNKHHTEESKRKMSDTLKGHTAWNKGIPHTEETKQKISKANTGKIRSEEAKKKTSESIRNLFNTPEYKQKLADAGKLRRKYDDEFIENLKNDFVYLGTVKAVAEKYGMNYEVCRLLIRYGKTHSIESSKYINGYI